MLRQCDSTPPVDHLDRGRRRRLLIGRRLLGIDDDVLDLGWLNSNTRSDLARPSMGPDMLKGRRTEIDFINGVIAEKGDAIGRPAPTHRALVAAVKRVEHGAMPARPENLYAI